MGPVRQGKACLPRRCMPRAVPRLPLHAPRCPVPATAAVPPRRLSHPLPRANCSPPRLPSSPARVSTAAAQAAATWRDSKTQRRRARREKSGFDVRRLGVGGRVEGRQSSALPLTPNQHPTSAVSQPASPLPPHINVQNHQLDAWRCPNVSVCARAHGGARNHRRRLRLTWIMLRIRVPAPT